MTAKPRIAVLHAADIDSGLPEELDTLQQAREVAHSLESQGYMVEIASLHADSLQVIGRLAKHPPALIFNLIEAWRGKDDLAWQLVAAVELLGIPVTGCTSEALHLSTNKLTAKRIMRGAGLPTPDWLEEGDRPVGNRRYIVKHTTQHGSYGMSRDSVGMGSEIESLIREHDKRYGGPFFAEEYIEGREFGVFLLADKGVLQVLGQREIIMTYADESRPRISCYEEKWISDSEADQHSSRCYRFSDKDKPLLSRMNRIAQHCAEVFGLKGCARIDIRCDAQGEPQILDVNANPCLAENASVVAMAGVVGLTRQDVITRLVEDAVLRNASLLPSPQLAVRGSDAA